MESDITAVLGTYITSEESLKRTITFVDDLSKRFPYIPLSLSCVGSPQQYQDTLLRLYGEEVVTGSTDRVSFSETWNRAILRVSTPKFVFLHNDMYLHEDFFKNLDEVLENEGQNGFGLYTTIEPLVNRGFVRPGKLVAPFGSDLQDFQKDSFNEFSNNYIRLHRGQHMPGYGFYLSGYTENLFKVGGFDHITYVPIFCEDDDLSLRIRQAGFRVYTVPEAVVYHFGSKTTRSVTGARMTNLEIESNRKFARKWGCEARYLWETGYEFNDDIDIGTETISFYSEVPITDIDFRNVEPMVDTIERSKEHEKEADIEIIQVGPTNFNEFAYLVGNLRWNHRQLVPGQEGQVGSYKVRVNRVRKEKREDKTNYLSLLK